ncbi:Osmolarity sensor protein EnvZ [compost metagenome]
MVEDEGSNLQAEDIEKLFAPFQRGDNARAITGYGLGLTIVSTVARQHNGELRFWSSGKGLRAVLTIARH